MRFSADADEDRDDRREPDRVEDRAGVDRLRHEEIGGAGDRHQPEVAEPQPPSDARAQSVGYGGELFRGGRDQIALIGMWACQTVGRAAGPQIEHLGVASAEMGDSHPPKRVSGTSPGFSGAPSFMCPLKGAGL